MFVDHLQFINLFVHPYIASFGVIILYFVSRTNTMLISYF